MAKLYTIRNRAITQRELENRFHEFVDETNDKVKIMGLEYQPSYALKEVDPTAYNESFSNWLDMMCEERHFVEKDDNYYSAEDFYAD